MAKMNMSSSPTIGTPRDYEIDPITGHKLYPGKTAKSSEAADASIFSIPVKKFKGYTPQFGAFAPPAPVPTESTAAPVAAKLNNPKAYVSDSQLYLDGKQWDEELQTYVPVKYAEPDGNVMGSRSEPPAEHDTLQEALAEYEKKASYSEPFQYAEPDGNVMGSRVEEIKDTLQQALAEYPGDYYDQPFKYAEPDGNVMGSRAGTPEHILQRQLEEYKPFAYAEPDGNPMGSRAEIPEHLVLRGSEAKKYKPFAFSEPHGAPVGSRSEAADALAEALGSHPEEYKPFGYMEPNGNPVGSRRPARRESSKEASRYKPYGYNEPDGKPAASTMEATVGDAAEYKPFGYNEPDGKPVRASDAINAAVLEANKYQSFGYNEPDGKPAVKSTTAPKNPKFAVLERDADEDLRGLTADSVRAKYDLGSKPDATKPKIQLQIRKETAEEKAARQRKLGVDFNTSSKAFEDDKKAVAEQDAARRAKEKADMAQAFKIEASELLNHHGHINGKINAALADLNASSAADTPVTIIKPLGEYVRKPTESSEPIQPSLDRLVTPAAPQKVADPYTTEPKGLELSFLEEMKAKGDPNPAVLVSAYGAPLPGKAKSSGPQSRNMSASASPAPTSQEGKAAKQWSAEAKAERRAKNEQRHAKANLAKELKSIFEESYGPIEAHPKVAKNNNLTKYKIAVFDADKGNVVLTETNSSQPARNVQQGDVATVLLGLDNASKFVPWISVLKKQGYEVVAGSGDVLVFRQIISAAPAVEGCLKEAVLNSAAPRRNPIDGMQAPHPPLPQIYMSPTGFTGYERPLWEEDEAQSTQGTADKDMEANGFSKDNARSGNHVASARYQDTAHSTHASASAASADIDAAPAASSLASSSFSSSTAPAASASSIDTPHTVVGVFRGSARDGAAERRRRYREERRQRRRRRPAGQRLKRAVVGGLAIGGVCYAGGVVKEFFREGGSEGVGTAGRL
jgi:hypothetical protein